jgi:ankyrin repeat protein
VQFKDDGATALIMASQSGYGEIVEALLAKGADTELRAKDGHTALDHAKNAAIKNMLRAAQNP